MSDPRRVVFFGTYDKRQHPRIAVLIEGLRANGVEVVEVNEPVWRSTEEKVRAARGSGGVVRALARTVVAWRRLWSRYRAAGPHDAVVVGYMGHLDVLLARLAGRPRRVPVVLDLFVSLYDTAVEDRKLVRPASAKARMLRALDRWAYRAADVVLFDTDSQRDHFCATLGADPSKARVVPVGAESLFAPRPPREPSAGEPMRVLFYGLYTPLQGARTIAEAARLLAGERIEFTLIGDGQDRAAAEAIAGALPYVRFLGPMPYEKIPDAIAAHDVVLGVFGSGKGLRVIPNKVFQAAAVGRAIVTSRSDAIERSFGETLVMVPPEDPASLADALVRLRDDRPLRESAAIATLARFEQRFSASVIGRGLASAVENAALRSAWVPPPRYLLRKEIVLPLVRRVPQGGRVLEVGVGAGDLSATLARAGYTVEGIDASASALAEAERRAGHIPDVRIRQMDLFALPDHFDAESFDGIVAMEVLEHVREDSAAVRILRDLLVPGGRLVVSVPAHASAYDDDDRAVGHYRRYDREQIGELLVSAGLVVDGVACYGFPLGNLLKWVRARRTPAPDPQVPPERLSDDSGIRADLPRRLRPFVRRETLFPFLVAQRLFLRTDLGEGYVVAAHRPPAHP